jgi:uncharacterized protein (UPF0332 family)
MKEEIRSHIIYRIDKAKRYINIVEKGIKTGIYETNPHNLYYAFFYMVIALMLTQGYKFKTHTGIKNEFLRIFVKTGKIDFEYGDFFKNIFLYRQENDYEIVEIPNKDTLIYFLEKSKEFVIRLESQIEEELKNKDV